jgi:hypothetical protein
MTRLICLTLALAAAVPLVGCGGKKNNGNATASSSDKGYQAALKFSACMRSHGLPNFPDPQQSSGGVNLTLNKSSGLDPNSATFKSAQAACRKYAPSGRKGKPLSPAEQQKFLAYSQCMRTHGVPSFPDPKFTGGGAQIQLQGIGPGSPGFEKAQKACQSKMPGRVGGPGGGTVQKGGS